MTRPRRLAVAPALVLFDLDGTLVDSVRDLAAAADEMMDALGRAPAGEERVRRYVGNGVERLVHRCLTGRMDAEAPPALFAPALASFLESYQAHNGRHSTLYPGVIEGLNAAARGGALLGCVTNKPARFSEPLLARLGLQARMRVIISGDTTARRKPDPAPLFEASRRAGVAVADTLLVGDSDNDVLAARAAGMPVVCVSYGYNHGRDIADSAPDAVLDSLAELAAVLPPPRVRT